jgi:hypothetical protein
MNPKKKTMIFNFKEKLKLKNVKAKEKSVIEKMTMEEITDAFKSMAEWAEEDAKKPWTRERTDDFLDGLKKIAEEAEERDKWYRAITTMSHEKLHRPFDL